MQPQTFRNRLTTTTQIVITTSDSKYQLTNTIYHQYTHTHTYAAFYFLCEKHEPTPISTSIFGCSNSYHYTPPFGFPSKKTYAHQLHQNITLLAHYYIIVCVYDIIGHSIF
jgi:hypothetical protein